MRVRAIATGFYGIGKGGALRYPGAEFDIPDGEKLASWMEKANAPKPPPKVDPFGPMTLSELARGRSEEDARRLAAKTVAPKTEP